jgi:DNA polymerase-3 subunit delta'
MSFDSILGQERAVAHLRAMLGHGRVPSALLFLGPHGVGKRTTALELAKALNCTALNSMARPGEGCGACPSCRKIAAHVHADVELVSPDGQYIKIDQVRAITDKLALIPLEARRRVIVIQQAERLNPAAANAFLKTLEEPPEDTLIVLTANHASLLPETIVSRCMPLRFAPLGTDTLRAILARHGELSEEEAAFALRHAQGRLRPELRQGAGKLMLLRDSVLSTLENLERIGFDEIVAQSSKWSGSEEWPFAMECMEAWFHDLALAAVGAPEERLIHGDRRETLARWSRRVTPAQADECLREVLSFRDGMALNVNKALALEALCLNLRRRLTRFPAREALLASLHQGG